MCAERVLMIVVVSSLVAVLNAVGPTSIRGEAIIIVVRLKLGWGTNLILVRASADHASTIIITHHHSTCHVCITCCQPINSLLLLVDDLWVLKYNGTKRLDTIMLRFKTHGNFAITFGACHRHIWTILFQMVSKFFTSIEHSNLFCPKEVWLTY